MFQEGDNANCLHLLRCLALANGPRSRTVPGELIRFDRSTVSATDFRNEE